MANYEIIYTEPAREDLDRLPPRQARQIVSKIGRLQAGLHGDIKRLQNMMSPTGCAWAIIASCLMLPASVLSSVESKTAKTRMTKAVLERVDTEIKRRRTEVTRLHVELEDLDDYLDVLEARRRAVGKHSHTQAEMEKRYRGK